jgi:hypothetical protein
MRVPLLMVFLLTAPAIQAAAQPIQYFVSGVQKETLDKDKQRAHERALRDARSIEEKSMQTLARALEKQHGRARDKWPATDRDRMTEVERKYSLAAAEFQMAATEQKDIDDSAADLKKSIQKLIDRDKERRLSLTGQREQATLAIDVVARSNTAGAAILYLKLTPVNWLPPDKLAGLVMRRRAERPIESAMIPEKDFDPQSPYWIVSVWDFITGGGRWPGVADTAAELITEAALGHLDIFKHQDPKNPGQ